jgi:phosphonate transport system substrate-binding protein
MNRREFVSCLIASASGLSLFNSARANGKTLILGIFPRRNIKLTYKLFTPLAIYLSEQLGVKVNLETAKSFDDFWKNIKLRRYDIVHFNQYHYIVSHQSYGYDVIAANKELGSATIAGSLIVRKDSGINDVSDLKGKTILFGGDRRAMQSFISATWLLRKGGLQEGDYIEKFAVNPPNTVISTFFKRADASGSGDMVMQLDNVRKRIDISQLKLLAKTEPMVHLPWAVRNDLPEELQSKIKNILVNLNNNQTGRQVLKAANLDGLLPVVDTDFNRHREIVIDVYGRDFGVSKLK